MAYVLQITGTSVLFSKIQAFRVACIVVPTRDINGPFRLFPNARWYEDEYKLGKHSQNFGFSTNLMHSLLVRRRTPPSRVYVVSNSQLSTRYRNQRHEF